MSITIGFIGVGILLAMLMLRVPVAIAMIAVSFGGVTWMIGLTPALGIVSNTPFSFVASWTMSAVPLFVLMGFISYYSGLTGGLFLAAKAVFRKVPGALAISSIFACSGFAAVCGSSMATAASMGRMAIPEMVKSGYNPGFAAGAIAAGGTLGALIPPSILMIVYGVFAETSVTKVFIGGITMGVTTALSYCLVVLLVCWLRPDLVPRREKVDDVDTLEAVKQVWPVLLMMALIFGGLFSGFFTATEAGAVGAAGSIVIAAMMGKLSWAVFRDSMRETLNTTASILIIGVGAAMFTRFLGLSGVSAFISQFISGSDISYVQLMTVIVIVYLILGMFMEPFGAMMITLPVLLPVLKIQGVDLVFFGVLLVKLLEIGMLTPPVGMNVFVIRNVASEHVTLAQAFKGVTTFIIADLAVVVLAIAFPAFILWLPGLL